jgi:3-phosphoshikimate 1-carboxyvinyltransferase
VTHRDTTATFGGGAPLRGQLRVPGDKSISHRALLFAALARGASRLSHLAPGEDVAATRQILERLGVRMRVGEGLTVGGSGIDSLAEPDTVLDCANSGTTMRTLAGLLAGRPFLSVLTGDGSLRKRPMARVIDPLRAMGATIDGRDDGRLAPLTIRGGALHGGRIELPVASAQVKSALVLAALQADAPSQIVSPELTRDHTERMLAALGAPVRSEGTTVHVDPLAAPWEAFELAVPGDPSSAAFFAVAATITPGSEVVLTDVLVNPTRIGFVDVLARMGADITVETTHEVLGEPVGTITVRSAALRATAMRGAEIPSIIDEIPVLAIAAAFADGVTEIRDAEELAVKETNRIGAVQQELQQLGIGCEAHRDGLTIRGGVPRSGVQLKSHGDHRMAMAAAVAAHALDGESTVRGWAAVGVSYPGFADDLASLVGTA